MIYQQVLPLGLSWPQAAGEQLGSKAYKTELVPILTAGSESATSTAQRMKRNHPKVVEGYPGKRGQHVQRP